MPPSLLLNTIRSSDRIRSGIPSRYITDKNDFIENALNRHRSELKSLPGHKERDRDRAWKNLLGYFNSRTFPSDPAADKKRISHAAAERLEAGAGKNIEQWRDGSGRIDWNCGDNPDRSDWEMYWQRNNISFLLTWARAAPVTDSPKLRQKTARIFLEWYDDCPVPPLPHREYWDRDTHGFSWREIEVSVRGRMLQSLFLASRNWKDVPERFHVCLLMSIKQHLDYLSSYTYRFGFIPGNHQTHHAPPLFAGGILFPELEGASVWKSLGLYIFKDHIQTDHDSEGIQNEYSPGYHYTVLKLYLDARSILAANSMHIPKWLSGLFDRAAGYCRYATAPGGRTVNINDSRIVSSGPFLKNLSRTLSRPELDPENLSFRPASRAYKAGGIAFMRTGWNKNDSLAVLDATGHNSGHWHAGKPNILIYAGLLPLVCEHQFATYDDPSFYNYFHTAEAHNTVMVDGTGDNIPVSPWEYEYRTEQGVTDFASGETADIASAFTNGYSRLEDPVDFERTVVFLKPGTVVVHDFLKCAGTHEYDWLLHFFPQKLETDTSDKTVSTSEEFPFCLTCRPAPDLIHSVSGPFVKKGKTKNRTDGYDFIGRDYWNPPENGGTPALLAEAPYTVWNIKHTGNTGLTFILQIKDSSSPSEKTVDCIPFEHHNVFVYRIGRSIVYFNNEQTEKNKILKQAGYTLKGKAGTVDTDTGETVSI